jgi:hypothetical protein
MVRKEKEGVIIMAANVSKILELPIFECANVLAASKTGLKREVQYVLLPRLNIAQTTPHRQLF